MRDEFIIVCRILQLHGADPWGAYRTNEELSHALESDPDLALWYRSHWEAHARGPGRQTAEQLVRLLHSTAAYVSNLIAGPVPVLLPRAEVRTLHESNGDGRGAALALGRADRKSVV